MINRTTSRLDYYSIMENLGMIDSLGNDGFTSKFEYYYQYEENFISLAAIAADLYNALSNRWNGDIDRGIGIIVNKHFDDNVRSAWDTVIASMDDTPMGTLARIDSDIDEEVFDPDEYSAVQKKYRAKLERLTKKELLDLMLWVSSTLMKYLDVKAAYDTLFSVIEELENNNSMLNKNGALALPNAADVF